MNQTTDNPESNQLGAGVSDKQLADAVRASGYPLQVFVGKILRQRFDVQEEWSFVDRDTDELRSMDLLASVHLHEWDPQPRVRPSLHLLVECKQSDLPYVFFLTTTRPHLYDFPFIAGLQHNVVRITTDDDKSTWTLSIPHALDLHTLPFQQCPEHCYSFSKAVRKGKDIELSGTESYHGLVLPLTKALHHFRQAERPPSTAWYFDAHLALGVAVLDAPMIGVRVEETGPELIALPWVRVVRHEHTPDADHLDRDRRWAVDLVHKDFFDKYLDEHAIPFAKSCAERVLRHPTELATGEGFISGMGKGRPEELEPVLTEA